MDLYQKAWQLLLKRIEGKTSWGRNDLKETMLGCLVDAGSVDFVEPADKSIKRTPVDQAHYDLTGEG